MSYLNSRKSARLLGIVASVITIAFMLWSIFRSLKGRGKSTIEPSKAITRAYKGTRYEALTPYVIAQAKHETGGFNTKLSEPFDQNNNMFGMQRPYKRNTTDNRKGNLITEGKTMANYNTLDDSAVDLILWKDMFKKNPFPTKVNSAHEYAQALKDRGYYTDSVFNYSKALGAWM